METVRPHPLVALTWVASTLVGAGIAISLLLVVLTNLDTEQPVPARQAQWYAVFTDAAAALEGPAFIQTGAVALSLTNTSDGAVTLSALRFPNEAAWAAAQESLAVGDDSVAGPVAGPDALVAVHIRVGPKSELSRTLSMARGFYLFDWVAPNESGTADHVWRIAAVEVTD